MVGLYDLPLAASKAVRLDFSSTATINHLVCRLKILAARMALPYYGSAVRLACRIAGSFVAKAAKASKQTVPPIRKVAGVPTMWAIAPNNKLPNDSMPRLAITNKLMTRPRF